MKCFVCKNKIGLLDDKGFTQDHKFICYQDINKLFDADKARKHFVPADLKREINQMTIGETPEDYSALIVVVATFNH